MSKKLLIIFTATSLLLAGFSFAEDKPLEIIYPELPGGITVRPTTIKTPLPEYIKYLFNFAIWFAGIIVFGSLIYGGILYITSAGNPSKFSDAKERIFSGILGLVVLLSSYLILTTINPQLIFFRTVRRVPLIGGVVLYTNYNGTSCDGDSQNIIQNTPKLDIDARCLQFSIRPGELEITLYPEEDYQGSPILVVDSDIQTPLSLDWVPRSINFSWRFPGVYLCTAPLDILGRCPTGTIEQYFPKTGSTALLEPGINEEVKSLRIINAQNTIYYEDFNTADNCATANNGTVSQSPDGRWACTYPTTSFGIILHEKGDWQGQCSVVRQTVPDLGSFLIGSGTSSVTIFDKARIEIGEGVWLCNPADPTPDDLNDRNKCLEPINEYQETPSMPAGWDDVVTSVIIKGSYLAVLFTDPDFRGNCDVFGESWPNVRNRPIGRCHCIIGEWGCGDCLSSYIIIPTK